MSDAADDPWAGHVRGSTPIPGSPGAQEPAAQSLVQSSGSPETAGILENPLSSSSSPPVLLKAASQANRSALSPPVLPLSVDAEDELEEGEIREPSSSAAGTASIPAGEAQASVVLERPVDMGEDSDDEEAFVYTGASSAAHVAASQAAEDRVEEPEVTDGLAALSIAAPSDELASAQPTLQIPKSPSIPVDHAQLASLATTGPLASLKTFFQHASSEEGGDHSAFALANEPSPASGLVPLHYAAKEGRSDIVKWLVEEAGALAELEDREGETALHKAALAGKLPVISFLLTHGAEADAKDNDGWTALHNASSRGYLDIVRVLTENYAASVDVKGGRAGWTPLMNAAAGGHLPVVRYLCSKWNADPFARNAAGETAYDVAAATFETFVCEVLDRYEAERWAALRFSGPPPAGGVPTGSAQGAYNPLRLHTTVPIILHENQRLDTRLSTLAVHGGKPRWSGTSAGRPHKPDRRAPGTMPPGPLSSSRSRNIPMRREDVGLPTRDNPYKLVLPTRSEQIAAALARRQADQGGSNTSNGPDELASTPTPQSVLDARAAAGSGVAGARDVPAQSERSHFWLSDWQTDLTHPLVDAEEGWQYAQSFDAPDERWAAAMPPPLARLLEGKGLGASVSRAVTGGLLPGPGQTSINGHGAGHEQEAVATGWVRRRRWVRVMRRRLDIEIGDELEAAELAHFSATLTATSGGSGNTSHFGATLSSAAVIEAEQAAREACFALGPSADYLARSKALAGESATAGSTPADALGEGVDELRRRIARLDLAVAELRASAFSDVDADRRSHAEDMLKEYTLQLGQLRQAAGLEEGSEDGDTEEDEEFIYPNSYKDDGQSVITRLGAATGASSLARPALLNRQSSTAASVFGAVAPSEAGTSITAIRSADLAASSEFRVPQNERPNRYAPASAATYALREQNLVLTWQSDNDVIECPDCQRKFSFFLRKHHCRRCGQIRCDRCSSTRAILEASEIVIDPGVPEMLFTEASGPTRICNQCNAERQLPPSIGSRGGLSSLNGPPSGHATLGGSAGFGTHTELNGVRVNGSSVISDVSSRASELNECPVCNTTLASVGESVAQEEHVRTCLENGGGGSVQGGRYLIYKLTDGPIVGKECIICLEDLQPGMTIARLPCLCYYHRHCIDSWFSRGKACPTHARSW